MSSIGFVCVVILCYKTALFSLDLQFKTSRYLSGLCRLSENCALENCAGPDLQRFAELFTLRTCKGADLRSTTYLKICKI